MASYYIFPTNLQAQYGCLASPSWHWWYCNAFILGVYPICSDNSLINNMYSKYGVVWHSIDLKAHTSKICEAKVNLSTCCQEFPPILIFLLYTTPKYTWARHLSKPFIHRNTFNWFFLLSASLFLAGPCWQQAKKVSPDVSLSPATDSSRFQWTPRCS